MSMLQERKARRDASGGESDDESAPFARSSERRRLSHDQSRAPSHSRETRWALFLTALGYLGQVFVEVGRRAMRFIERSVPRYIAFIDRLLIRTMRSTDSRLRRTVRLIVLLAFVLAVPYLMLRLQRAAFSSTTSVTTLELSEDEIRPHILVDRRVTATAAATQPQETKRRAFLRANSDGLQLDDTRERCENTVQGAFVLTDSLGFVCTRTQQDALRHGCCNASSTSLPRVAQFTCNLCDTHAPHCCDVFEHCVSCCMHPLNENLRRAFLTHADASHPVYSDPSALTVFQYCTFRCRTSSASVQHQNSYRSHRAFCYGIHRPLRVLPTVNSDALPHDATWSDPLPAFDVSGNAIDTLVPEDAALELDPFYLND